MSGTPNPSQGPPTLPGTSPQQASPLASSASHAVSRALNNQKSHSMASPTTFQRDALSQHFLFDERPDVQTVETLARGLDMTSKEVEDWFSQRRMQDIRRDIHEHFTAADDREEDMLQSSSQPTPLNASKGSSQASKLLEPPKIGLTKRSALSDTDDAQPIASTSFYGARTTSRRPKKFRIYSKPSSSKPLRPLQDDERSAYSSRRSSDASMRDASADPAAEAAAGPNDDDGGYRSRLRARTKHPDYSKQLMPERWPWEKNKHGSSTSGPASEASDYGSQRTDDASAAPSMIFDDAGDEAAPANGRLGKGEENEEQPGRPPSPLDLMTLIPAKLSKDGVRRLLSSLDHANALSVVEGGSPTVTIGPAVAETDGFASENAAQQGTPSTLGGLLVAFPKRARKAPPSRRGDLSSAQAEATVLVRNGRVLEV